VGLPFLNEAILMLRASIWPWLAVCALSLTVRSGFAADDPAQTPPPTAGAEIDEAGKADAKAIFAAQCGWCHGDYGMTAARGPQLAGTQMTEREVAQRIRNGKPGYMPGFKQSLDDAQIALVAKYIKSLQPEN
jgi:mono/diheme cytochrome c family protein